MEKTLQFFNICATDLAVGCFFFLSFQLHSLIHSVHSASHFLAPNSLLCPFTFFTSVMSFICFFATTRNHLWQSIDLNMYNMWSLLLLLKQLFPLFCLYPFYIKSTMALGLRPHIFTVTMIPRWCCHVPYIDILP